MIVRATFEDQTVERQTGAAYSHASRRDGVVRFHTSAAAARRRAGRFGEVVATDQAPQAPVAAGPRWRVERRDGTSVEVAADNPLAAIASVAGAVSASPVR